jgi:hypothetical protein
MNRRERGRQWWLVQARQNSMKNQVTEMRLLTLMAGVIVILAVFVSAAAQL